MTARILRRLTAVQDAEEIADYIAKDSLEVAIKFLENVESTLNDLALLQGVGSQFISDDPELGGIRYHRVKGFPKHLIFFVEHKSAVEVVRILHGARDLGAELRKH